MNRLVVFLFVSFISTAMLNAQSFSERRKADRERWYKEKEQVESRERQQAEIENSRTDYTTSAAALEGRRFVLEADRIVFKYGQNVYVNSNTNFISLFDDKAVVQISPMNAYPGFNGLGGITLDGRTSDVKVTRDKKNNIRLSMNVMGAAISARVDILLYEGSDQAQAVITPNFNSNRIELTGIIVPFGQSEVFKGTSI